VATAAHAQVACCTHTHVVCGEHLGVLSPLGRLLLLVHLVLHLVVVVVVVVLLLLLLLKLCLLGRKGVAGKSGGRMRPHGQQLGLWMRWCASGSLVQVKLA
jgi:hypothetical protein